MYSIMAKNTDGVTDILLKRDSVNTISISMLEPLRDEQAEDLVWAALLMLKTGKSLKEILKEAENNDEQYDTLS
jgi:hypothetical protein